MTVGRVSEAVVQGLQERVVAADELVEAAAFLVAEAAESGDWNEVTMTVATFKRAKAQRRYAWAAYESARRDRQALA